MRIKDLVDRAHKNAQNKGFWDERREKGTLLMLVVSELGEAVEADRLGDEENFCEEIADTFIRLADFCGGYGIDIEKHIAKKMAKNEKRKKLHGKKY